MAPFKFNSILLVDDDEISNLFNKIFLNKLDLDVDLEISLNGKEAIEILKLIDDPSQDVLPLPCLLLLDIQMPEMDGWTFLQEFEKTIPKEVRKHITIIMLTTSRDEGDRITALKNSNVSKYLQKPLSEEKFVNMILSTK